MEELSCVVLVIVLRAKGEFLGSVGVDSAETWFLVTRADFSKQRTGSLSGCKQEVPEALVLASMARFAHGPPSVTRSGPCLSPKGVQLHSLKATPLSPPPGMPSYV